MTSGPRLKAQDPQRGWWKCPACGAQLIIFGGEVPARPWTWTDRAWTHTCACGSAPVTAMLIDRNPE